jgi:hypothetical protein
MLQLRSTSKFHCLVRATNLVRSFTSVGKSVLDRIGRVISFGPRTKASHHGDLCLHCILPPTCRTATKSDADLRQFTKL